jgi:predicted dehydrogenase
LLRLPVERERDHFLRTAIIGVGSMGRRHLQVVRDLGLDLGGICDQRPESLALAAAEHDISAEKQFTNATEMFRQARPECVVVSTTAPSHCEYTCAAAEAGVRFILCEKPMATSLAQCDRMIAVCEERGVTLAINHPMRFMEQYTESKRLAQSEAFGGLTSITVIAGNLGLAMNGTHLFEMFRFMTDEAPAEVTGWLMPEKVLNPRGAEFEDHGGAVRVTTASGKRLYLELGADQGHGMLIVLCGHHGRIMIDPFAGLITASMREEQYRDSPTTRYNLPEVKTEKRIPTASAVEPSRRALEALLQHENFPTGEQGRQALEVLVAAYVSDENGHIPLELSSAKLPRDRTFPWA